MSTVVYLIRHGEYVQSFDKEGRRLNPYSDTPLSQKGKEQIVRLATRIGNIDVLYTSPFRRTRESGEILQQELHVPTFVIEEQIRDVWAPGWSGLPVEELKATGGDIYSVAPRSSDQETLGVLDNRIFQTFQHIVTVSEGKRIGIVFHGDPIRLLVDRLSHPRKSGILPDMKKLAQSDYLAYAEAWKLVLGHKLELESRELIGRSPEQFGKGERIY